MKQKQAIADAGAGWVPSKHPRGRDGKFIETGAFVQVFDGPSGPQVASGRVTASYLGPDGRIHIGIDLGGGKVAWYRPKQIQTVDVKAHIAEAPEPKDVSSGSFPEQPLPSVPSMTDIVEWDDVDELDLDLTPNAALAAMYGWPDAVVNYEPWTLAPDGANVYTNKTGTMVYVVDGNGEGSAFDATTKEHVGAVNLGDNPDMDLVMLHSGWAGKPQAQSYAPVWKQPAKWDVWLMDVGLGPKTQVFASKSDPTKLIVNTGVEAFVYHDGHMAYPIKQDVATSIASQYVLAYDGAAANASTGESEATFGLPEPGDPYWGEWLTKVGHNPVTAQAIMDPESGAIWVIGEESLDAEQYDQFGEPTGAVLDINTVVDLMIDGDLTSVWEGDMELGGPAPALTTEPDFSDFGIDETSPDAPKVEPLMEWEQELLDLEPAPAPAAGSFGAPPVVAEALNPYAAVYSHPQGSTIIVYSDESLVKFSPTGANLKTSATAAKLQVGHGGWKKIGYTTGDPDVLHIYSDESNSDSYATSYSQGMAAFVPVGQVPSEAIFAPETLPVKSTNPQKAAFAKKVAAKKTAGPPPLTWTTDTPVASADVTEHLAGASKYYLYTSDSGPATAYAVVDGKLYEWISSLPGTGGSGGWVALNTDPSFLGVSPSAIPAKYNSDFKQIQSDEKVAPPPVAPSMSAQAKPGAAAVKIPKGQTPKSLIMMIATSFANKNPNDKVAQENFTAGLEMALAYKSYDQALTNLSSLMTAAKLGGKQRARYKALLQMHFGVQPAPGSSEKSAVIGDPGKWRPVEPASAGAGNTAGVTSLSTGSNLVQSGGTSAGTAKANIQENLTRRLNGRVTTQQILDAVLATQNDKASNLVNMANALKKVAAGGKPEGYVAPAHAGHWALANGAIGSKSLPANKENLERALLESVVSMLVATWASTSNDNNPRSLAMQHAAEVEFGLKDTYGWTQSQAVTKQEYAINGPLYREFLRVMYENTQEWAKANGVTKVRLRRGEGSAPIGAAVGAVHTKQYRPLSSFSSASSTAEGFGNYVVDAVIPIEWIIGNASTGFGCRSEYEWVILGGKHQVRRLK